MATELHQRRFPVMGTTAHVMLVGGSTTKLDHVEERLNGYERRWSRFLADSELSKLNASAGSPCIVSLETYNLVSDAIAAWEQTDGHFDPTVGAIMVAAGYDQSFDLIDRFERVGTEPGPAPGPQDIVLHPYGPAIHLPADVQLDLGGIAKGTAADLIADELLQDEASAAADDEPPVLGCLINIGGDLRVAGQPPRPEGWRVRLACAESAEPIRVTVASGAVCTSTTEKRRWVGPSGPQHHLRDPATGEPIDSGIASVTVIGARAAQADVLAKTILAAGPVDGTAIAEAAGVTGIFVLDDATVRELPGLDPFLTSRIPAEVS